MMSTTRKRLAKYIAVARTHEMTNIEVEHSGSHSHIVCSINGNRRRIPNGLSRPQELAVENTIAMIKRKCSPWQREEH